MINQYMGVAPPAFRVVFFLIVHPKQEGGDVDHQSYPKTIQVAPAPGMHVQYVQFEG